MSFVVRAVAAPAAVERLSTLAVMAHCAGLAELPAGPSVELVVGFDTEGAARRFVASIDGVEATVERPVESDWASTESVAVVRNNRRIDLAVGTSFGHGSHPTTALALDALDDLGPGAGRALLDVGCGTGVLSIWAAGAGFIATGCDIELSAVACSSANAARNGVSDRTRFVVGTPSDLAETGSLGSDFAVAVVNTLIGVHEREGRAVLEVLEPGAALIVTGALGTQEHRLAAAYPGRRPIARRGRQGWVLLVLGSE